MFFCNRAKNGFLFFISLFLFNSYLIANAQNPCTIIQTAKNHVLIKKQNNTQLPQPTDRWQYFLSKAQSSIFNLQTIPAVIKTAQFEMGFEHRAIADLKHLKDLDFFFDTRISSF